MTLNFKVSCIKEYSEDEGTEDIFLLSGPFFFSLCQLIRLALGSFDEREMDSSQSSLYGVMLRHRLTRT